jgi:hypothetical protein
MKRCPQGFRVTRVYQALSAVIWRVSIYWVVQMCTVVFVEILEQLANTQIEIYGMSLVNFSASDASDGRAM